MTIPTHRLPLAVAGCYAIVAFLFIPVFPHFVSPNEMGRWATAAAIVEHGTFEISRYLPLLGGRFEDLSVVDGRTYSNKAPGATLVGLAGYLAVAPLTGPASGESMRLGVTAMRIVASTIPLLLIALLLARLGRRFGADPPRIAGVLVALLFGTPLFTYGLLNFSHALTAASLFAAWTLLFLQSSNDESARRAGWQRDLAGGALIGLAVFSEYPAAVAGASLMIVVVVTTPRRLVPVVLGGLPFAAALALYNEICFGSPFQLSSAYEKHEAFRDMASSGLFGIAVPSPEGALRMLTDPSKGLLVFSPFLLLAVPALRATASRVGRPAVAALLLVVVSLITLYSGYPNWHGGWTVGPRYLVPILPFLVFPLLFREQHALDRFLIGASVAAVVISSLVFPFIPAEFPFPWGTFSLPLFVKGLVAPNLLHWIAPGIVAQALLALALLAPLAVAFDRRGLAFALAGAIVWTLAAVGFQQWNGDTQLRELERTYIEEVYFEREGALDAIVPPGRTLPPGLAARRIKEKQLPPPSWPF